MGPLHVLRTGRRHAVRFGEQLLVLIPTVTMGTDSYSQNFVEKPAFDGIVEALKGQSLS